MPALCSASDITNQFMLTVGGQGPNSFTTDQFNYHISVASSQFISAAKSCYQIDDSWSPDLSTIGFDVRSIVAIIAAYGLICMRGFQDSPSIDDRLKQRYDWAIERLANMQDDMIHLPLPSTEQHVPFPVNANRANAIGPGGVVVQVTNYGRED